MLRLLICVVSSFFIRKCSVFSFSCNLVQNHLFHVEVYKHDQAVSLLWSCFGIYQLSTNTSTGTPTRVMRTFSLSLLAYLCSYYRNSSSFLIEWLGRNSQCSATTHLWITLYIFEIYNLLSNSTRGKPWMLYTLCLAQKNILPIELLYLVFNCLS